MNFAISKDFLCRLSEFSVTGQEIVTGLRMPIEGIPAKHKASNEKGKKIQKRYNAKYFCALAVSPEVFHERL